MKSTRIEIILLIVVLFIAVAANEAPLAYDQRGGKGGYWYPPVYPRSVGKVDGWVLESGEFTNVGGTLNSISPVFIVGDNAQKKQYRSILHFNTAPYSIPPTAIIYKAVIRIKLQGIVGTNPFTSFGSMYVDMRKPSFGTVALTIGDFQVIAGRSQAAYFTNAGGGWYKATLSAVARAYINKAGSTQFRLYFKLDDDNDSVADYMKFYSGDAATASLRPSLELNYYLP